MYKINFLKYVKLAKNGFYAVCTSSQYFRNLRMTLGRSHFWGGPDLVGTQNWYRSLPNRPCRVETQVSVQLCVKTDTTARRGTCHCWPRNPKTAQENASMPGRGFSELGTGTEMLSKQIPTLCKPAPSDWQGPNQQVGEGKILFPHPHTFSSVLLLSWEVRSGFGLPSRFLELSGMSVSDWEIHQRLASRVLRQPVWSLSASVVTWANSSNKFLHICSMMMGRYPLVALWTMKFVPEFPQTPKPVDSQVSYKMTGVRFYSMYTLLCGLIISIVFIISNTM